MAHDFFDSIPLDEVPQHSVVDFPESGAATQRPTVLVVDDERIIADTLVAILNRSGFSALAAYSGESAFELITTSVPDLLITDVCMPGISGIELAIRVREHFSKCKVLLFSGSATSKDLMDTAAASGHDFELLNKPVHPRDLIERLKRCA